MACWFLFDWSNETGPIDVIIDGSVLKERASFEMQGLTFSIKLDWIGVALSLLLKLSQKSCCLSLDSFCEERFFLLWLLYISKSIIHPCMEYCCHVRVGAPNKLLEVLDKLQKRLCGTVGPSLAASLEHLAHCQSLAT